MDSPITGYAEGFYGRLLSWPARRQIIDTLQQLNLTTYYYAPKEDPCHRLHWRTPYSKQWREDFKRFCEYAHEHRIRVVAGVAPGLDFDFSELPDGHDFASLATKSAALLEDGADVISLLMDDIDTDFHQRCGRFATEGHAHAALANALGDALSTPIWVTPRIYADELINDAPDYLSEFVATLAAQHCVLYCGSDVVAHTLNMQSANALKVNNHIAGVEQALKHRVIFWDNLYANDYCPRRLFTGPWVRREQLPDVLLNPTGMVHTDCLLLELMAMQMQCQAATNLENEASVKLWQNVLRKHDVPVEFQAIAPYFNYPHFNAIDTAEQTGEPITDHNHIFSAIEHCLWRWKTPLSREWYAFIFGLKHDLLAMNGKHPPDRILKTQTQPLAHLQLKYPRS